MCDPRRKTHHVLNGGPRVVTSEIREGLGVEAPVALKRGLPTLLDEHVLQPDAERVQFLPEPVSHNVGLIEFVARLLTGRKEKDQRLDNSAVGGDVASLACSACSSGVTSRS
jgi:hypothetical protein